MGERTSRRQALAGVGAGAVGTAIALTVGGRAHFTFTGKRLAIEAP